MINEIKEILKLHPELIEDKLCLSIQEVKEIGKYVEQLENEIGRQEKAQVLLDNQNAELQDRINKALEYMRSEYTVTDDEVYLFLTNRVASLSKLENILKGDDNESNN